ncbi:hypothetical protein SO802_018970 [Lithocarpus litseifolius]|uniref:Uncharacterized protein n=1 Tax=Lithocarpus litseifolius TaxID=425828 RepID=A0AAW2CPA9_9ROSI
MGLCKKVSFFLLMDGSGCSWEHPGVNVAPPLVQLVIKSLDQLKTGKGPATVKTIAGTTSVILLSSLMSIVKIQNKGAKLGTMSPMDQGSVKKKKENRDSMIFIKRHHPSSPSSSSSSYSHKLVPWLSWDEWLFVKDCLFSNSPDSVATAFRKISAWRSRGCLPVAIEVTASIIEIQQKDPHFRENQSNGASDNFRVDQTSYVPLSEDMLAMLYCMAIIRLVNGVVEKTRKKTEVSLAVATDAIGIPRMLIDIRHGRLVLKNGSEAKHYSISVVQVSHYVTFY